MTLIARTLSTAAIALATTAFLFQVAAGPVTADRSFAAVAQTRA